MNTFRDNSKYMNKMLKHSVISEVSFEKRNYMSLVEMFTLDVFFNIQLFTATTARLSKMLSGT